MLLKFQKGYLLIISLLLVLVIGMLGAVVASLYTNVSKSVAGIAASDQAFFIATSGMESVKFDLIRNNVACSDINSSNASYTNVPLFSGYYSANGTLQYATANLTLPISTSTQTTVTINNINNFLPSSILKIEDEILIYFGKSGNNLINALRGIGNSVAKPHSNGAGVTQNVCILTVTAGVPNLSASLGKRIVQSQILLGYGGGVISMGLPTNPLPLSITPALLANGGVNISASATINNPLQLNLGCALAAVGGVNIQGSASNLLCAGVADPLAIWSSNYNNPPPPYTTLINASNPSLYGYFFAQSIGDMMNQGVQVTSFTPAAINAAAASGNTIIYFQGGVSSTPQGNYLTDTSAPVTLIVNGGFNIGPNAQFGDADHPVILLINGGFTQYGGGSSIPNINGLLYVNGGANFQTSKFTINGAVVVNGGVNAFKNSIINFDAGILQQLGLLRGINTNVPSVNTPEVFK